METKKKRESKGIFIQLHTNIANVVVGEPTMLNGDLLDRRGDLLHFEA